MQKIFESLVLNEKNKNKNHVEASSHVRERQTVWFELKSHWFIIAVSPLALLFMFYFAHKDYSQHQYIRQFETLLMVCVFSFLGWKNTEVAV